MNQLARSVKKLILLALLAMGFAKTIPLAVKKMTHPIGRKDNPACTMAYNDDYAGIVNQDEPPGPDGQEDDPTSPVSQESDLADTEDCVNHTGRGEDVGRHPCCVSDPD